MHVHERNCGCWCFMVPSWCLVIDFEFRFSKDLTRQWLCRCTCDPDWAGDNCEIYTALRIQSEFDDSVTYTVGASGDFTSLKEALEGTSATQVGMGDVMCYQTKGLPAYKLSSWSHQAFVRSVDWVKLSLC